MLTFCLFVIRFSNIFLSGEGDVTRHLSLLGFSLHYSQNIIDEIEYRVNRLEVDLRDGVMLCRLVELLTKDSSRSLSHMLRIPVVSRLQKVHNVLVPFKKLAESGVPVSLQTKVAISTSTEVSPLDIVDGHCQKTLG